MSFLSKEEDRVRTKGGRHDANLQESTTIHNHSIPIEEKSHGIQARKHELRIQNQTMFLDPPIESAKDYLYHGLHEWLGEIFLHFGIHFFHFFHFL